MYGTVARLRVKPGADAQLAQHLRDFTTLGVSGFVAAYLYTMDANPNERYMVVVFESRAAYVANAESAEQNARYQQMRALLDADPDWHDGEIATFLQRKG